MIRDEKCQKIFNLLVIQFQDRKEGLTTKQVRIQLGSKGKEMPKRTFYIHANHLIKDGHISKEKNKKKASNSKTTWFPRLEPNWEKNLKTRDNEFYSLFGKILDKKLSGNKLVSIMPYVIFYLAQIYAEALFFHLINNDRVQYNVINLLAEKKAEEVRKMIEPTIIKLSTKAKQEIGDNFQVTSTLATMDWAKRISYSKRFPKKNKTPYDIRAELDLTFPTGQIVDGLIRAMKEKTHKNIEKSHFIKIIDEDPSDFRQIQERLRQEVIFNKLKYDKPELGLKSVTDEVNSMFEYFNKTGKRTKALSKEAQILREVVFSGL